MFALYDYTGFRYLNDFLKVGIWRCLQFSKIINKAEEKLRVIHYLVSGESYSSCLSTLGCVSRGNVHLREPKDIQCSWVSFKAWNQINWGHFWAHFIVLASFWHLLSDFTSGYMVENGCSSLTYAHSLRLIKVFIFIFKFHGEELYLVSMSQVASAFPIS